jgi:hypothetical protein
MLNGYKQGLHLHLGDNEGVPAHVRFGAPSPEKASIETKVKAKKPARKSSGKTQFIKKPV